MIEIVILGVLWLVAGTAIAIVAARVIRAGQWEPSADAIEFGERRQQLSAATRRVRS